MGRGRGRPGTVLACQKTSINVLQDGRVAPPGTKQGHHAMQAGGSLCACSGGNGRKKGKIHEYEIPADLVFHAPLLFHRSLWEARTEGK